MHRDFTLSSLRALLSTIKQSGYHFLTFREYCRATDIPDRVLLLRHDVDRRPDRAAATARLEHDLGITGTYYFRALPCSFEPDAICEIAGLGHEIGYHYEDLALEHGDHTRALASFSSNLARLRSLADIDTICMHGSPMSRWDNRDLWRDPPHYRSFGILGEPYLDADFSRVGYLTDTGRRWDGDRVSVRDRVSHSLTPALSSSQDVEDAFRQGAMPPVAMITLHPQRWTDSVPGWAAEIVTQSVKNAVKRVIVSRQNGRAPNPTAGLA